MPVSPPYESELTWLHTGELAARIAAGEVSAREALVDQLARIDAVNPAINAIVTRDDERAFAQAEGQMPRSLGGSCSVPCMACR